MRAITWRRSLSDRYREQGPVTVASEEAVRVALADARPSVLVVLRRVADRKPAARQFAVRLQSANRDPAYSMCQPWLTTID